MLFGIVLWKQVDYSSRVIGGESAQPLEFILRHAGKRLTMQTAAMERVPDSLVPLWVIPARPMEPGTAARKHGIHNARE